MALRRRCALADVAAVAGVLLTSAARRAARLDPDVTLRQGENSRYQAAIGSPIHDRPACRVV